MTLAAQQNLSGSNTALQMLELLSACRAAVGQATSEASLEHAFCRVLVERAGYHTVWIGHTQPEGSIHPTAFFSHDPLTEGEEGTPPLEIVLAASTAAAAAAQDDPTIISDIGAQRGSGLWRQIASIKQWRSAAVFPLRHQGQILGTLSIYASYPDAFDDVHTAFLTEIAGDLALRIGEMRTRQALVASETRYRGLVEQEIAGIFIIRDNGSISYVNPAFRTMLGYTEDETLGKPVQSFLAESDQPRINEKIHAIFSGRISSVQLNATILRKDGSCIDVLAEGTIASYEGLPAIIGVALDITEQRRAEERAAQLTRTDALTGLPNRAQFLEILSTAFAAARRSKRQFAVLYLDIDMFKDINDTLGHPLGDTLLQSVAGRLKKCLRETDVVARFGGDEFAILQSDISDPSDAGMLATKICDALTEPFEIGGRNMRITASIGIALNIPGITGPEALLTKVELALYRAKEEGRNQFRFHSADLDREVLERFTLTSELRAALDHDDLEVYYQPQVHLATGRIVGLEALCRWNHPQRGRIMPDTFIQLAERSGLISRLGRWMLNESCKQITLWRQQGITPPPVAVNVSAVELRVSPAYEEQVSDIFKHWNIGPGEIELEITETVLMETTRRHSDILTHLSALGAKIAIDDFGTGFSSLEYLRSFSANRLKIAQQFVLGIPENKNNASIIRATMSLVRELGLDVIAEGVETKAQLDFLIEAGCEYGQGYYFSKPVSVDRTTALLSQGKILP
jgi:diguanylate cyclase (GGDEF)-like protein/PAS domain S-box-containing protein